MEIFYILLVLLITARRFAEISVRLGQLELVIADIALRAGVFSYPSPPPPIVAHLFSAVVIMAIATTLVTPLLLRFIFLQGESDDNS